SPGARRSSSPTGSRPSAGRTSSCSWRRDASPSGGRTKSSCRPAASITRWSSGKWRATARARKTCSPARGPPRRPGSPPMKVRPVRESDWTEWLRLTRALFPQGPDSDYEPEMRLVLERDDAEVFVVERPDGKLAGYVHVGTRSVADGCPSGPVGYIEEWYVDPDVRRKGHGRALLAAAEAWAGSRGFT